MASSAAAFSSFSAVAPAAAVDCRHQVFGKRFVALPVKRSRIISMHASQNEDATLEQCQAIVAEQLGVDVASVKPESKFAELGADSLDTVEIVMAMEEKFKIQVEQEGAEKIATVKDAADMIHKLVSQKDSA